MGKLTTARKRARVFYVGVVEYGVVAVVARESPQPLKTSADARFLGWWTVVDGLFSGQSLYFY